MYKIWNETKEHISAYVWRICFQMFVRQQSVFHRKCISRCASLQIIYQLSTIHCVIKRSWDLNAQEVKRERDSKTKDDIKL